MENALKRLDIISNSKYTAIVIFICYMTFIVFLSLKEPILYALALIPLTLASIAYKYLSKKNAKFLKEFNDTLLYLIASFKAIAYAGNNIEIDFLKKIVSFSQETDPFIISWIIILTCTYLKTLICATECISSLRKKKPQDKEKNKIRIIVTPIIITEKQSLRITTEQSFSVYNRHNREPQQQSTKKVLISQSILLEP
ncbi:hypothetical protein NGB58_15730 [Escherichia coli]|nr:hypothetical protein [Escherichia coli]